MPTLTKRRNGKHIISLPKQNVRKKKKAIPADSTHMQLWFANSQMVNVQDFMAAENRRRNLVGRDNKVHAYMAIPMLVDHGVAFTNHEVYVPADKLEELLKDKVFRDEYRNIQNAMKAFRAMIHSRIEADI